MDFSTKNINNRALNILLYTVLIFYSLILLFLLIVRFQPVYWITGNDYFYSRILPRSYNFTLFKSIRSYPLRSINIFGNILLFIPLGMYFQFFCMKKNVLKSAVFVFFTSLSVETLQYILATGAFDVDDIILNFIGGIIGILICKILYQLAKKDEENVRLIIAIGSAILAPYLLISTIKFFGDMEDMRLKLIDIIILFLYYGLLLIPLRKGKIKIYGTIIISGMVFALLYFTIIVHYL